MDLPSRIGRYQIERPLGQGDLGRVFLARDPVLERQVAIKILRDDLGLVPELQAQLAERIRHEARAAAVLSHPSIVALHDMGEDEHVGPYIVFEFVLGPTLRVRLAQGPLQPIEVGQLARALGSALSYAHAAGVIHRDVKPENVMMAATGPMLTDFGIARLADKTLMRATAGISAPAYSAPEVLASGGFSAYSDVFSLATTLYEALTGSRAFGGGDAADVASRVRSAKQPAPTVVAPRLRGFLHVDAIFDRALAKEPRNRFPSCEVFGTVLAAEVEGANIFLPIPVSQASIVPRATRKWQNTVGVGAVLVIVALVVLGRQRQSAGDGVSLRSVANEFAVIATPPRAPAPAHRPRPAARPPTDGDAAADAGPVEP